MDYAIEFLLEPGDTSLGLLRRIASVNEEVEERQGAFHVPGGMLVMPGPEAGGVLCRNATDKGLYLLLSRYFDTAGESGGVLVTPTGTSALTMVAIVRDEDTDFGETPLGFNVQADELLANESVFLSAWPNLIAGTNADFPDTSDEGSETVTGHDRDQMIFADVLATAEDDAQTVSFLFFGVTPQTVMEDIVKVPAYERLDPEFLTYSTGDENEPIEAVSFDTGEGPAVELRLPVTMANTDKAIRALAAAMPSDLSGKVCFATDIIDAEEVFLSLIHI